MNEYNGGISVLTLIFAFWFYGYVTQLKKRIDDLEERLANLERRR